MTWNNDTGLLFKSNEIKLFPPGHTWQMRLGQFLFHDNIIRIITYTLPDMNYIQHLFERRPRDIWIIAHRKFTERARQIKQCFPDIQVAVQPTVHSKVAFVTPKTLFISSANFGYNGYGFPS